MTKKGTSASKSIISTIKSTVTKWSVDLASLFVKAHVSYPQRGYSEYVNSFSVPGNNENVDIRWYYTIETFEVENPAQYRGVYGSYEEEKEQVERNNFISVKDNALEMLEKANIFSGSEKVSSIVMQAYENVIHCETISDILITIEAAQRAVNVYSYKEPELDDGYLIRIKY